MKSFFAASRGGAKIAAPAVLAAFILSSLLALATLSLRVAAQESYGPEAEFHMARMIYANSDYGRGGFRRPWWAIDYPAAEFHFTRGIRRLTGIDVADDSQHLELTDDDIFDYPWLFIQQVGTWYLSDEEIRRMREYLLRGGFILVDDFHGNFEWQVFADVITRVMPDRPIVDLAPEDEILHVLYDLNEFTQIPGRRHLVRSFSGQVEARMEGEPRWRGIYDEDGRLMVAIHFNMDTGDAWEHADDPVYPEPMTALAYRIGINYIIYAMTH